MSLAAWLLSSSEKLVIGSSIANIYARDSFTAQWTSKARFPDCVQNFNVPGVSPALLEEFGILHLL